MTRAHRRPFPGALRRAVLTGTVALLALLPAAARAPRGVEDYEAPIGAWREGPVRYLLTKGEDDAFRALATDPERALFIQRFWASRDPNQETPENEYRTLFYRRVLEANRMFNESTKAGWKTDRGKIYILLGPPDELDRNDPLLTGYETILWTYRNPPAGLGLGTQSAIRFVRDRSGEYRLSSDLRLSSNETSLGLGLQVQAMQMKSLPEPRKLLDTIVSSRSFLDAAPFRTHRDFFRSADGNTFTVLTVGVKQRLVAGGPAGQGGAASPRLESDGAGAAGAMPPTTPAAVSRELHLDVVARLTGGAPGLPTYDLAGANGLRAAREDATVGPDDYLLYQGALTVKPGSYVAYYGVVDRDSGQIYSFKESIDIPDLKSDALALSSVTLASSLERVSGGTTAAYAAPFVLGNLRVLPRPDDQFRNGETFAFYYQIYGPATDPIDGRPDLDVEYQFFVARGAGVSGEPAFEPLGKPIRLTRQQSQVQGYSFPLKDWPAATYRLRVSITDNLSGRQSSRDVTFRVL